MKSVNLEIAQKTGLSYSFVNQCINRFARPSWENAKKLADATGTRPEMWMEGTREEIRAAIGMKPRMRGEQSAA